jgi:hypothetical protein
MRERVYEADRDAFPATCFLAEIATIGCTREARKIAQWLSLRAKRRNLPPILARRRGIASSLLSSQ